MDLNQNSTSFDIRICDDLCKRILSFLSFEDKVRYECISQQWKRLIFEKEYEFIINKYFEDNVKHNEKTIECVLRKFKYLKKIKIDLNTNNTNENILKLIIKYSKFLTSIKFDFSGINCQVIETFGIKFEKRLTSIKFIDSQFDNENMLKLIKLCPKLVSLKNPNLSYFINNEENCVLENLNHITMAFSLTDDIELFKKFINVYKTSIKTFNFTVEPEIDSQTQKLVLGELSKMNCLQKLTLNLDLSGKVVRELTECLKRLALNCNQLINLELTLEIQTQINFKVINNFKNLKHLSIDLDKFLDNNNNVNCKSFKEMKNLIDLRLTGIRSGDEFFKDIDLYLPNLKRLEIINNQIVLNDLTFHLLTKLNRLHCLFISYIKLRDEAFLDFINNSSEIRNIEIYSLLNISHEVIDGLVLLARKKSKVKFRLKLDLIATTNKYWQQLDNKPLNLSFTITSRENSL